jgi:hypothetical protein
VRRLVIVAFPCLRDGWHAESLAGMEQMGPHLAEPMKQSPPYEIYARVAPRPQDWPVLLAKTGDLLRRDYDWSDELGKITAPVMLVFADADSVRPAHIAEFYALVGGGLRDANWDGSARSVARLAVLPGYTHYDVITAPGVPAAVIRSSTRHRWSHRRRSARERWPSPPAVRVFRYVAPQRRGAVTRPPGPGGRVLAPPVRAPQAERGGRGTAARGSSGRPRTRALMPVPGADPVAWDRLGPAP